MPFGLRPAWPSQDRYEWLWLYTAAEPATGESFSLFLPYVNGVCFELFLQKFSAAYEQTEIMLLMDNAPSHTSKKVVWPEQVCGLHLPPYSPELNPAERIFEDVKEPLANQIFDSIEELEKRLTSRLKRYWDDPQKLKRLTCYPWWPISTSGH
jgi:transposase